MPYLPVYYDYLGLPGEADTTSIRLMKDFISSLAPPPPTPPGKRIGQLGAITPATTFLVAPLWGALADRTGRHKDVLMFTFIFSVISRLLFIYKVRVLGEVVLLLLRLSISTPVLFSIALTPKGSLTDSIGLVVAIATQWHGLWQRPSIRWLA